MEPTKAYKEACDKKIDDWIIACGGHEKPTRYRDGRVYLYVYNPSTGEHGWLDMSTDIVRMDPPG